MNKFTQILSIVPKTRLLLKGHILIVALHLTQN